MTATKDTSVTAPAPLGLSPQAAALKPKAAKPKAPQTPEVVTTPKAMPEEKGGPKGPEPTRYGDWERKGRCSDF